MAAAHIRVMTYDLDRWGKDSRKPDYEPADWFGTLGAEIVGLQGIWANDGTESEKVDGLGNRTSMFAQCVTAPKSHCHLALLWRPDKVELLDFYAVTKGFWYGAGIGTFAIGNSKLRVIVSKLTPSSREQRLAEAAALADLGQTHVPTVIAGGFDSVSESDREPDLRFWPPNQRIGRATWLDEPGGPRVDRRPMELFTQRGLDDAAAVLDAPWTPTADLDLGGLRVDAIRVNPAARSLLGSVTVHDDGHLREWGGHLPVSVTLEKWQSVT